MSNSKKLARNIIFVYSRLAATSLIGLVTARLSFQALGQSDFGLYNVVGGVIAIIAIISTAMSTTTRRYINIEAGKSTGNLNKIFNSCLIINAGIAILVFLLAETIGLFYICNYLNVENDMFSSALVVFHICTLTSAISLINVPHQSLLAANEHFGSVAIIDVVTQLSKLILVACLFFVESNRIIHYAAIMCSTTLLSLIAYTVYCKRRWPKIVELRLYKDLRLYKEITIFNNYIALGASSYVARAQGSNMLINYFFGTVVNGAFSIAYLMESYVMMVISNLTTAAAPQITKEYSAGNIMNAINTASKINRLSIIFMFTLVFLLLLELPYYLKLWLGDIPVGCIALCEWTLISAAVRSLSEGIPPLVQASGKIKWFQIIGSGTQLLTLLIGWYLFSIGLPPYTIIVAFVVTTVLNFIITLFLLRMVLNEDEILMFMKGSFLRGGLLAIGLISYYIIAKQVNYITSPLVSIIVAAFYSIIMIYLLGLTNSEKMGIVSLIKNKMHTK